MDILKTIGVGIMGGIVVLVGASIVKQPAPAPTYGAVASPDIISPYIAWGGVSHWGYSTDVRTSSSTLCSIQSPAATSTLVFASLDLSTGSTTVLQLEVGKNASNPTSTSTSLGILQLTASANTGTLVASTTPDPTKGSAAVFGPSQYLNFKYGGSACDAGNSLTCTTLAGRCKAVFVQN